MRICRFVDYTSSSIRETDWRCLFCGKIIKPTKPFLMGSHKMLQVKPTDILERLLNSLIRLLPNYVVSVTEDDPFDPKLKT